MGLRIVVVAFDIALTFSGLMAADQASPPAIEFGRDVLPILRRACFECHGAEKQEGGLRLDQRAAAMQGGDSGAVIVARKADESELIRRVALPRGHDEIMPARGEPLTRRQIDILRAWINTGAHWPETVAQTQHWAYMKPVRPQLPKVRNDIWVRSPIDAFILRRLEQEGLQPSSQAAPTTLIRRIYLDLIGIPPSPAEVSAILREAQLDEGNPQSTIHNPHLFDAAYERAVDRLLASEQFGVRWTRPWLDYARYADSHGFQRDDFRDLWPYRDWVVNALNADMPFDQFTLEQLAGDLLPNATESQRIATGFNRSAPTNVEAGSDPEETRVNQVFDRVNTVGMVWLGTTFECCQCHNHKYDPFTQQDYYGLFAFFNQTAIEADRSNPKVPGSIRFLGPEMPLVIAPDAAQRSALQSRIGDIEKQLANRAKQAARPDTEWESRLRGMIQAAPQEHVLDVADFDSVGGATHEILPDKSVLLSGEAPDRDTYTVTVRTSLRDIRAVKLETLTHSTLPGKGPGRGDAERPNFVLNTFALESQAVANTGSQPSKPAPVRFTRATADFSQARFDPNGAIDDDAKSAWAINPKFHEPHWALFETAEPIGYESGTVLTFQLVQNFGGSRTIGRLRLTAITGNVGGTALPSDLIAALDVPHDKRADKQRKSIADYRLNQDPEYVLLQQEKTKLDAEVQKLKPPTTLVMQELAETRSSSVFMRGDFRTPGQSVEPATPAALHPLKTADAAAQASTAVSTSRRPNRVDLARWLIDDENPLTARVVVNRWWAELFGHGLVTTPEDFGIKGEPPTHPELLDWLAVEYRENGWSLKRLLKSIVLSATYRQSSHVTPELLARDDGNLLYARGPRYRLDAELIRDNALAIAGLLSLKTGGPPIRPYQPDGLWVKVGGQRYDYIVSAGSEKYRRGLYVVWKRGAPYPSFINFDANNRLACRVKRPRSNTPLQALTLLNDPVYVEAALHFARRVLMEQPSQSVDARIDYAFRLAVQRPPKEIEFTTLRRLFESQLASDVDSSKPKELLGSFEVPPGVSEREVVAWYAVATALLNLDETITRP